MALAHVHGLPKSLRTVFIFSIALNFLYVIIEFSVGIRIGSLGLISDAGHNMSDVLSLIIAWIGARLAHVSGTGNFTYGLRRAPIVGTLFNALLLFGVMGIVAREAIGRLSNPPQMSGTTIIVVTIVGIVVNFGTAMLFAGKNDLNMRAAFLHMMADGAVTLGVLLSGISISLFDNAWIDPIISLVIVVVVLWSTWGIFRDAVKLSLDAVPPGIDPKKVHEYLCACPGVEDIHHLHIWAVGLTEPALTVHIVAKPSVIAAQLSSIMKSIRDGLKNTFGISHATMQFENEEYARTCVQDICHS